MIPLSPAVFPQESASAANVRCTVLPNGIKVLTEQMPHVRSVSAGIWVTAGSRCESAQHNGISHFIEHMVFKGTKNRSAEDIARQTDSLGGHLDAFTSKELVCFNAKMLDEHLEKSFDILSDLVLNPLFVEEDIEKEKGVILEELKMGLDEPENLVHDLFSSSFWEDHAVGRPIIGTKKTIQSFTREMILEYFGRYYTPNNLVISAAGNLTHDRFLGLVESKFGQLQPVDSASAPAAPKTRPALVLKNKRSLEQVHVCMGVPCNAVGDPRRFASYVLSTLLGGSMSSRLFQNIREKRGLAYSVFTEQMLYRDAGCFMVYAGTSLDSTKELIRLTLQEFRELREQPVSDEELRRAKDNMKGSFMLGLESTHSRMSHIARQHIYFGGHTTMDEILAAVENVTAAGVQELSNEFFQPERLALTILGNLNGFQLDRDSLGF
ncbi:MAG: insulinase family protein [Acidobacteria bacterium]|nr:insulinase family protein [Acidobacteriota bacterium]